MSIFTTPPPRDSHLLGPQAPSYHWVPTWRFWYQTLCPETGFISSFFKPHWEFSPLPVPSDGKPPPGQVPPLDHCAEQAKSGLDQVWPQVTWHFCGRWVHPDFGWIVVSFKPAYKYAGILESKLG